MGTFQEENIEFEATNDVSDLVYSDTELLIESDDDDTSPPNQQMSCAMCSKTYVRRHFYEKKAH